MELVVVVGVEGRLVEVLGGVAEGGEEVVDVDGVVHGEGGRWWW